LFSTECTISAQTIIWQALNGPDGWAVCVSACDSAIIAGTLNSGIARSTDNGNTWVYTSNYAVRTIAASGATVFAGSDDGALYRSTDNGATWTESDTGFASGMSIIMNGTTIFVGAGHLTGGGCGIFRSTDNGDSWTQVKNGLTDSSYVQNLIVKGHTIFTEIDNSTFRSTDNGTSWTKEFDGLVNSIVYKDSIVLITKGSSLFRSTDNGNSWFPDYGLPSDVSFSLNGNAIFAETTDGIVYRSTNDGNTWTDIFIGSLVSIFPLNDTLLLARNSVDIANNLFFISTNNGTTWIPADSGLPADADVRDAALYKTSIFTVGYGGGYRSDVSSLTTAVSEPVNVSPANHIIAYPNPVSRSTNIDYSLAQSGYVSLKVYDALGKEVSTLVNGDVSAGAHTAEWQPQGLPDGVYFYRLQAGSHTESKQLLLVH
ncbi:MAG TPA: T9SS type A sorting domain-containing protein, partial [Candidatus Kapabacteria bacterium]|nr:T9SS type A sorting domain-containing protein [Candidatus Kapabacteria bacterium]